MGRLPGGDLSAISEQKRERFPWVIVIWLIFTLQREQQNSSSSTWTVPVCSGMPALASLMATVLDWVRKTGQRERTPFVSLSPWGRRTERGGDRFPPQPCV